MSDDSVAAGLRSAARLVVVEAPAGCGKTFQGAEYARDAVERVHGRHVLILAHTHAACDVFSARTSGTGNRLDVRTIDSLISEITGTYHAVLGLPADTGEWARNEKEGYRQLASKVALLLRSSPMVARSLAQRYPVIIFDEHQDASADQHALGLACHGAGACVRIFGDPMQRIFKEKTSGAGEDHRWQDLAQSADVFCKLDTPHRWRNGSSELGDWILAARAVLRDGGRLDLRGSLPKSVSLLIAENNASGHSGFRLVSEEAKPIHALEKSKDSLLILSSQNATVDALRAFFNRQLPIWEGHVRADLSVLVRTLQTRKGDAIGVAEALVNFMTSVATGFSPSAFGRTLLEEVRGKCLRKRSGKPATLQSLARGLLEEPNHQGVAKALQRVHSLTSADPAFSAVKIDHRREFWDAIRLGEFADPHEGVAELSRRRSHARQSPAAKSITTVHKAKGLECDHVLIMPCDNQHFGESSAARCLLYVALSRARRSVSIVASRKNPSPLLAL